MRSYLSTFANRESAMQAIKVAVVGVANTIVSFALFNIFLASGMSWFGSVTVSFALTTFMSLVINRRWTFSLREGRVSRSETLSFFAVNIAAYFATVGIMWVAEALFGPLGTFGYNVALIVASGLLLLPKLAGYRDLVFSKALGGRPDMVEPARSAEQPPPVTTS